MPPSGVPDDPDGRTPSAHIRDALATPQDHHGVCSAAIELLHERFGAIVASVGYATFASGQLCVLTDAPVEGHEIPSFVSFPLSTRMLLADTLGSSEVRVLDAAEYAATYPTVSRIVGRPNVATLAAVGFSRHGITGSLSLGVAGLFDAAQVAALQSIAGAIGDALAVCEQRSQRDARAIEFQQRFLHPERSAPPSLLTRCLHVAARSPDATGAGWHDRFELDDGRVVAVVGDVAGHGTDVVVTMARAAASLRALLVRESAPEQALEQLDRVAAVSPSIVGVRCLVAIVDPSTGVVDLASAGHPAALVRAADGAIRSVAPSGAPVGAGDATPRRPERVVLDEGGTIVLVGDGLMRCRRAAVAEVDDLAEVVSRVHGSTPGLLVAELVEHCLGDDETPADLVVVALHRVAAERSTFSRSAPATPTAISGVRRELGAWLIDRGAAADAAVAQLAVSELMSNVVEHAYRSTSRGSVLVEAALAPESVSIAVIDEGRWSSPIVDSIRGRGLSVVERLAAETSIRSTAQGTIARIVITRTAP